MYAGAVMGTEIQYYQDPNGFDLGATLEVFVDQYITWLTAGSGNERVITPIPAERRGRRK